MGRVWVTFVVLVAIGAGACSDDAEPPPLTDPTTSTTQGAAAAPEEKAASTTPTTLVTTTIVFELHDEPVGSLGLFEEQVQAVYDRLGGALVPRDEVPFPDATNPDPVVAFGEMIEFNYWMLSTNPWRDWVQLYALKDSRWEQARFDQAGNYSSVPTVIRFEDEVSLDFTGGTVISLEAVEAPDRDTIELPDTAVGIEFTSTVSDFHEFWIEEERVLTEWHGWTELVSQAIVVPTEAGWRIAYVRWND